MKHVAYPLVATAVLAACVLNVHAGTPRDCADPRDTAAATTPVADDPDSPLDPRDPQFSEKQAQRYRRIGRATPPAAGATR